MFTRVVEITTKPGKTEELANTIQEEVLPILKKQTGSLERAHLNLAQDRSRQSRLKQATPPSQR